MQVRTAYPDPKVSTGDLVIAERAGKTQRTEWTELGLVAAGKKPGSVYFDVRGLRGEEYPREVVQDVVADVPVPLIAQQATA